MVGSDCEERTWVSTEGIAEGLVAVEYGGVINLLFLLSQVRLLVTRDN